MKKVIAIMMCLAIVLSLGVAAMASKLNSNNQIVGDTELPADVQVCTTYDAPVDAQTQQKPQTPTTGDNTILVVAALVLSMTAVVLLVTKKSVF